jgi:hypothetical protein
MDHWGTHANEPTQRAADSATNFVQQEHHGGHNSKVAMADGRLGTNLKEEGRLHCR